MTLLQNKLPKTKTLNTKIKKCKKKQVQTNTYILDSL